MEIKEGMYVRTSTVGIKKIEGINLKKSVWKYEYKLPERLQDGDGTICYGLTREEDITKVSYDIIDLIQEGDYVNGFKVTKTGKTFPITNAKIIDCKYEMAGNVLCWTYSNKDIKSVVTKEQFESMKYEVE